MFVSFKRLFLTLKFFDIFKKIMKKSKRMLKHVFIKYLMCIMKNGKRLFETI